MQAVVSVGQLKLYGLTPSIASLVVNIKICLCFLFKDSPFDYFSKEMGAGYSVEASEEFPVGNHEVDGRPSEGKSIGSGVTNWRFTKF